MSFIIVLSSSLLSVLASGDLAIMQESENLEFMRGSGKKQSVSHEGPKGG